MGYNQTMKTDKTKSYADVLIAFRAFAADRAELDEVARRWQLNPGEVARRAFREGLAVIKKVDLPGTRIEPTERKGSA